MTLTTQLRDICSRNYYKSISAWLSTFTPSTIIFLESKNLLPLVVSFVGLSHPRQQKMKVKIEPCGRHLFLVVVQGVPASFGLILSKKVEF